ncbi:exoribonuclease R [Syntrophotalea carbinolica DSM 2380]|uniref:Ribonuclease R n=1 Tax=Syntrophotalea carbinolica (strain DSM 2380 / NBRC 103641 / GraBd1) TaxID=338963 RepID=Q3A2L6_SYNC1|nr:ribonuclease R [Syntrophotalea carbinolica]ABA89391.1 exoribonuclease R [Syntrophotalea carbinolica DSM 2380]
MNLTPDDLLKLLSQNRGKPLSGRQIVSQFQLSRDQRQHALRMLDSLADEGLVRRVRKGLFSLPRSSEMVVGKVSVHRQGYGFVIPEAAGQADVFIPARYMREVMDGDRVAVRVQRSSRGGYEGRVLRVLSRAHQTIVGTYRPGHGYGMVLPSDPALSHGIMLLSPAPGDAHAGDLVVVSIAQYPGRREPPRGVMVEVLGDPADPQVEILAAAYKFNLPREFSTATLEQARSIAPVVREEDLAGREDLRSTLFVTIDGETAKDFDDAVAVSREPGGCMRLWVAIADVGHYVAPDSPIDRDAKERGTSVYFPGSCLPMLPEALSNGICSLNPGVDRLVLTAEMLFDKQGVMLESRFFHAVICSKARLTYREVADVLAAGAIHNPALSDPLISQLHHMSELASRLQAMRFRRGSLDFDLPEPEIVLDLQGRPDQILRAERTVAHRLIEEFMLAANEAVAKFLSDRNIPLLYRIHESPEVEKLFAFQTFLAHLNIGLVVTDDSVSPTVLQGVLETVRDRPEERMVNQFLLRSMKQARYSSDNLGHFGLASDCYCHFTSPIRRYPDLVVHRILSRALSTSKRSSATVNLEELGDLTSQKERRAMEAERDIVALRRCQFMADKVGQVFDACVADVQPFGIFVELKDVFVEGLVHVATLTDDYYEFDEELHRLVGQRRRKIFRIGEVVTVQLVKVNLERRELDFELQGMRTDMASATAGRRRSKKKC